MPYSKEQQTRYDELVGAGASQSAAQQAVGLIPQNKPAKTSISSQNLTQQPAFNITQPQPATQAASMLGEIESFAQNTAARAQQDKTDTQQAKQTWLEAALTSESETSFQDMFMKDTADPLGKELDAVGAELADKQHALRRRTEAIRRNAAGTFGGAVEDMVQEAERESLSEQADLYIKQMAIQGQYNRAVDTAQRAAKALFEKQENRNKALRQNFEDHMDLFDKNEQRAFEVMYSDRQSKLEEEKSMRLARFNQTIDQENAAYKNRLDNSYGGSNYNGEYSSLINAGANLVGSERGKTTRAAMQQAIANGDYLGAYAQLANNVEESLTADNKIKFSNARTDLGILANLRTTIQQYQEAGGDTGFLKGTADQIARRFGQLKTDPKFAALAVQLEREFQAYRQNMTGAAFSPAESREYAAVNPRTTASIDLNLATIDGAMAQLENRVVSTINTRVPGSDKLYQQASGTMSEQNMSDDQAYELYLQKINGAQ